MSVTLSSSDVSELSALIASLLTPPDATGVERWRVDIEARLTLLLGAQVPPALLSAAGIAPGGGEEPLRERALSGLDERELALAQVLLPAVRFGLASDLGTAGFRLSLSAALDSLTDQVAVVGRGGRLLHVNAALRRSLESDPESDRIRKQIRRVAGALLSPARRGGARRLPQLVTREFRTFRARYRLRAIYLSPERIGVRGTVMVTVDRLAMELPSAEALRECFRLTGREAEVALLVAEGLRNAEIAVRLGISPHTAHHHTECVLLKVGVTSRARVGPTITRGSSPARDAAAGADVRAHPAGASTSYWWS